MQCQQDVMQSAVQRDCS